MEKIYIEETTPQRLAKMVNSGNDGFELKHMDSTIVYGVQVPEKGCMLLFPSDIDSDEPLLGESGNLVERITAHNGDCVRVIEFIRSMKPVGVNVYILDGPRNQFICVEQLIHECVEMFPNQEDKMHYTQSVYIEDTTPEELIKMINNDIVSGNRTGIMHKNESVVFTTDGSFLYASEVGQSDRDLFSSYEFKDAVDDYYGNCKKVVEFMKSMEKAGMELLLADSFVNCDITWKELVDGTSPH
jgi:hypothetical protein